MTVTPPALSEVTVSVAATSGTVTLPIPTTAPTGRYVVKYLEDKGYSDSAASNAFTVQKSKGLLRHYKRPGAWVRSRAFVILDTTLGS